MPLSFSDSDTNFSLHGFGESLGWLGKEITHFSFLKYSRKNVFLEGNVKVNDELVMGYDL